MSPTLVPPCLSNDGEVSGEGDIGSSPPLLHNIEHGTERDVPLLCIATLLPYLAADCDIVLIVEREIRNPQVRKDFPNG